MKKIAVYGKFHKDGIDFLRKNKFEAIFVDSASIKKLKKDLKDVEAIAVRTGILDQEILKEFHSLKIVSRHGVGYDNIDINFLNKNNIALAITGTSNAVSVSEHVMTMFLYLCKLINKSDALVRNGKFIEKASMPNFFEMYKKNILILGFGRIGKALAKRCLGFESNIYVYDPFIESSIIKNNNCNSIEFEEGIKIADFISLHLPLNKKTKNMIAKDQLNMMKDTCILVNTARGGLINEQDLVWALTNKKIYGAGLDVYEKEPPTKDNPLLKLENIILSPHNAALTLECRKRMAIETCTNIVHYLYDINKLNVSNIINKKKLNL